MEEQLEQTTQLISQILALSSCDHFILHLPFTGFELNEFLCSCFHRQFVDSVKTHGYHENAVYIEPRKRGRIFLCFSLTTFSDDQLSKLRDGESFYPVSVSDRDSLRQPKPLCYSLASDMVLEQPCFYAQGRRMEHTLGVRHALDALTRYLAIRDHCYDCDSEQITERPVTHTCKTHIWCRGLQSVFATRMPDWDRLFPGEWTEISPSVRNLYPYQIRTLSLEEIPGYTREPALVPLIHRLRSHQEPSVSLPHRPISNDTLPASSPTKTDPIQPVPLSNPFDRLSQKWHDTTLIPKVHPISTLPINSEKPQSNIPSITPSTQPAPFTQNKDYHPDQFFPPPISHPAPRKLDQTQAEPRSSVHQSTQKYTATPPRPRTPLVHVERCDRSPLYSRLVPGLVIRGPPLQSSTSKDGARMTAERSGDWKQNWNGLAEKSFTLDGKPGGRSLKPSANHYRWGLDVPTAADLEEEGDGKEEQANEDDEDEDDEDEFSSSASNEQQETLSGTAKLASEILRGKLGSILAGPVHMHAAFPASAASTLAEKPVVSTEEHIAHPPETLLGEGDSYYTQLYRRKGKENLNSSGNERRKARKKEYHQRRRREIAAAAAAAAAATAPGAKGG